MATGMCLPKYQIICFKIKVVFTPSSYNVSASCIITYNSSEMFDRVLNMAMIHFLKKCSTFCNISPLHCLSGKVECIPHWCNPVYTPFFIIPKYSMGFCQELSLVQINFLRKMLKSKWSYWDVAILLVFKWLI